VAREAGCWCRVVVVTIHRPAQLSIGVEDPPHEQWLVRLGCWMVGSSVINLIKKAKILRLVKRTMKEETYLLGFEALSNTRTSCQMQRTRVTWHVCSHAHCVVAVYWGLRGVGVVEVAVCIECDMVEGRGSHVSLLWESSGKWCHFVFL
jgi:hypothetical protein